MKKLILHIGFNKTGSTSIQANLVLNAKALLAQGILYPHDLEAPYTQRVQHVPLAAAIPGNKINWLTNRKRKSLPQAWAALDHVLEQTDFDTLLLSSEGFGGTTMGAKQIRWLQDRFANYDIRIIAYIRRQDSYLLSAYQQRIKAGGKTAFHVGMHRDMPTLQFDARLAPWRQAFGPERVIVRPFAPSLWPEKELFYDFLAALDIDYSGLKRALPENEGLDYRAVELLRRANALGLPRKRWLEISRTLADLMPAGFKHRKMQLSSDQAEMLRAYYRDSNLRALEGSNIDVDAFFPATPPEREACLPPKTLPPHLLLRLANGIANKHDTAPKGKRSTSA